MSPNEPLDVEHARCIEARDAIRRRVAAVRREIGSWWPAPMPEDWYAEHGVRRPGSGKGGLDE